MSNLFLILSFYAIGSVIGLIIARSQELEYINTHPNELVDPIEYYKLRKRFYNMIGQYSWYMVFCLLYHELKGE